MDRRRLDDDALASSAVVANNAMNRERQLTGVNSYARELGFHPLDWLLARRAQVYPTGVGWLDLCCGAGRALGQAAAQLGPDTSDVELVGVDLVDDFDPGPEPVRLVSASVMSWTPQRPFDLITCVHGLHYVGDKLGVLSRAASWLAAGGRFVADLDLASIRLDGGPRAGRALAGALRRAGFDYDARRHRISCTGPRELELSYVYLGADDTAGPNYTHQPAVDSYYRLA